ncbi:MAG: hypothetical protein KIH63_001480 [Candidatus Saccharibacteria bacterium]|nr:hypothetical protein [Candidatus Saccharibacteria bacterium]
MNNASRYIVGFLLVAIFVFFGVAIFRSATNNDDKKPETVATVVQAKTLPEYAGTDAEVSVNVVGPIIGEAEHRQIRITVSRDRRTLDVLQGYQGRVIKTKSYFNDQSAYDVFLRALQGLNFTASKTPKIEDEFKACPLGVHYEYALDKTGSDDEDFKLWSVSCGVDIGTFAGGPGPTIRTLFQKQIPDYDALVEGVNVQPLQ